MTRREVGKLCCKVLGIYTFITSVSLTEGVVLTLTVVSQGSTIARIASFLPGFLLLCFSAYLWLFADAIAERIFPNEAPAENSSVVTPDVIRRIAFVVAGILILNGALAPLTQVATNLLMPPHQMTVHSDVYWGEFAIRLAFASWLIFGSEKLRSLVKKDW